MKSLFFLVVLLLALGACGEKDIDLGSDGSDAAVSAAVEPDPRDAFDFEMLIEGDWEVQPGEEKYICIYKTVEEDTWVTVMSPLKPLGTHHVVLDTGFFTGKDDGTAECDDPNESASTPALPAFLYDPGNPVVSEMPPGVAIKLDAGSQMLLNVHLVNTTDEVMLGTSGLQVVTVPESEVEDVARHGAFGPATLEIPAGGETKISAICTAGAAVTLASVQAHMHQLGTHMKVTVIQSGEKTVVHDKAFQFGTAGYSEMDPMTLAAGDQLHVECTYNNTTDQVVENGPSGDDEMCLAMMLFYPLSGLACSVE